MRHTVLFVEDSKVNIRFVEMAFQALKLQNVNLEIRENLEDAIEYVRANREDILILFTDLEYPGVSSQGLSGLSLIDYCRQSRVNFPICVVSSYLSKNVKQTCIEKGASLFIEKPFVIEKFKDILERVIEVENVRSYSCDVR